MRYHLTLVRMAIIKSLQTINVGEDVEKREPPCTVDGNVNWYSHYGRQYGDSLKTRNKSTMWPHIPTIGHIPWGKLIEKDTCTPLSTAVLFTIARTWKQPRCPSTDKWKKKLWYIYTMEYYSVIKRNAFESVLWSEVSQKDKNSILIHTHGM